MDISNGNTGAWCKTKVLGSGGFGQVTLWCNTHSGEKIALKHLHELNVDDKGARVKQVERWCNEVDIMKKLNHKNIIATLEIPLELSNLTSVPILAMEYCSEGDLRQVLREAKNCCGLPESQVLNVMKDISSGLAYLHSCKIVHRDIKPENIVLQKRESTIIYKLIDLGYAKALDQSSLLKSFVGTIQYIAPELVFGKEYSSSVDYWSFGLLTYEVITGHRPFLPGFHASDWMKKIQGKPREVISVLENADGDITYSCKISSKNHLSRCLIEDIEKWLQLALDWDGNTRGRHLETKRLLIFESLSSILSKKIIHVFDMISIKILSYEITKETILLDVKNWLFKETGIDVEDQILILPDGSSLANECNIVNFLKNENTEKRGKPFFLYKKGFAKIEYEEIKLQCVTNELSSGCKTNWNYRKWRKSFGGLVHFIQSEADKCACFLQGIRMKIDHTRESTSEIEALGDDLREEWREVENFSKFLSFSHKIDLENYIYYRKVKKIKSSLLVQKWIQRVIDINNKITQLKSSYNISEHKQLVLSAKQKCRSLEDVQTPNTPLHDILSKAYLLWEIIQSTSKNEIVTPTDFTKAVSLITLCTQESRAFFNDQALVSLITRISEIDESLAHLKLHLQTLLKSISLVKSLIENTQKERQREIWSLIATCNNCAENKDCKELRGKEKEISGTENFRKPSLSINENVIEASGQLEVNVFDEEFQNVIKDNYLLRHRIHQVQQTFQQLIKNFSYIKLDVSEKA